MTLEHRPNPSLADTQSALGVAVRSSVAIPPRYGNAQSDPSARGKSVNDRSRVQDSDDLVPLLDGTARADRHAFGELYRLTSPRLFAVALRLLRERELAQDVLQEAYLAIWQKAGDYRAERGQPLAWMAGIVRNRSIDRLRQLQRQAAGQESLRATAPNPDWEARLRDHEATMARGLRDCLGQLQENQRKAIQLAYYYGLTHEELAEAMNAPLGTVKSWVRRGLLQLKDCFEEQGPAP